MGLFEREYQDALDGLRFSDAEKERIIKNLMEQRAGQPVKEKRLRPWAGSGFPRRERSVL